MVSRIPKPFVYLSSLSSRVEAFVPTRNLTLTRSHLSVAVDYQNVTQNNAAFFKTKVNEAVQWYEEFTGMDEVRLAQSRVLQAEESFRLSQEKRRGINVELSEVQNKLKEVYAELDSTTRGEDRYVHLITKEHKLLKEERVIREKFTQAERDERDGFAALSSSVKESHEKERAQAERTKYWSIIGSIIGTVIGIVGTSVNNQLKIKELKKLIKDSTNTLALANINDNILKNEEKFNAVISQLQSANSSSPSNFKLDHSLDLLAVKLDNVENGLRSLETNRQVQVVSSVDDSELLALPFVTLGDSIFEEHRRTRYMVLGIALCSVIVPILTKLYL